VWRARYPAGPVLDPGWRAGRAGGMQHRPPPGERGQPIWRGRQFSRNMTSASA